MHYNKTLLITGGSRGIGEAIAKYFAQQGYSVMLCGRTEKDLKQNCEDISKQGAHCAFTVCDVTKKHDVQHTIEHTLREFGRIDLLINNAGYAAFKPLIKTTDQEYDETFDVNLRGVFLFSREALPLMEKQGSGIIINVSSVAGKKGSESLTVYCASKFGVIGFTEALACETKNVKVCCVCPGPVNTAMYRGDEPPSAYIHIDQPLDIAKRIFKILENGVENGKTYDVGH